MSKYKVGEEVNIKMIIDDFDIDVGFYMAIERDEIINGMWLEESKIDKCVSKTYDQGLNDAWELVDKLNEMAHCELKEIFDINESARIVENFTPQEVLAKIESYEKEQEEIKVGDVVYIDQVADAELEDDSEAYGVVTGIYDGSDHYEVLMRNGDGVSFGKRQIEKTGKHIDIESLLEQIRGDE